MATVFFSYSHADEDLRDQIEKQLAVLKRQGVIETWHDRRIPAGAEIDHSISTQLETADIILLLVSSDFLNSDYCYDREMLRAMARHKAGDAIVIPVILRACDWHAAPFGKLMAVPTDGKAITQWPDRDEAMLLVARAVREAAGRGQSQPPAVPTMAALPVSTTIDAPRSSNLRLAKKFTQRDKDQFRDETFDFMAKFFENSLAELEARNPGIEGRFRRVTSDRFTAVAYRNGDAVARCTVFMGGDHFLNGIAFSHSETTASNGFNESLSVHSDDQSLFLRSMGMSHFGGRRDEEHLTMQGAAELYWGMFIANLQR